MPPCHEIELFLYRRLCCQNAIEAFAILQENQHPQYACHQPRTNARRHRKMEGKDVVQLCCKQRERQRHEEARKQKQSGNHLNCEKERSEVRCTHSDKEL